MKLLKKFKEIRLFQVQNISSIFYSFGGQVFISQFSVSVLIQK